MIATTTIDKVLENYLHIKQMEGSAIVIVEIMKTKLLLKDELSKCGIFNFKRRKLIKSKITELNLMLQKEVVKEFK